MTMEAKLFQLQRGTSGMCMAFQVANALNNLKELDKLRTL